MKNLIFVALFVGFSACAISPNNSPEANFSDLKASDFSNKPVQMSEPAAAAVSDKAQADKNQADKTQKPATPTSAAPAGTKAKPKPETKLASPLATATPTPTATPAK